MLSSSCELGIQSTSAITERFTRPIALKHPLTNVEWLAPGPVIREAIIDYISQRDEQRSGIATKDLVRIGLWVLADGKPIDDRLGPRTTVQDVLGWSDTHLQGILITYSNCRRSARETEAWVEMATKKSTPRASGTSDAQRTANRQNATKSTGPQTPSGKAASQLNALRHGLTSETPLLPGEDPSQREALSESLTGALRPVGSYEEALVEHIVSLTWRLGRVERIETALLAFRMLENARSDSLHNMMGDPVPKAPAVNPADEPHVISEKLFYQVLYHQVSWAVEDEAVALGRAFVRDVLNGDASARLSRYETTNLRNLERTWRLLVAAQDIRQLRAKEETPTTTDGHANTLPEQPADP